MCSCGVVVITSALHAEGPRFDPGRDQLFFYPLMNPPKSVEVLNDYERCNIIAFTIF